LTAALAELTHGSVIDVLNALKWYAFSYLIGNGDLHAKNISLYDVPGSPRSLTPAYDLICTRIYGDERMALKLNGKDQNLTRKMLIELGQQYGVPAISVHQMLDKMMGLFQRNQSILFSMPMNAKQSKLLKTMVEERLEDLSP
jgi:serine/threonine-protein kinase HipA